MIKDIIAENNEILPYSKEIAALEEHFPACFGPDGSFDLIRFSEYIQDKVNVVHEGYELKFLGKNYARFLSSLETETIIVPDEEHNRLSENRNSKNVYISGDNIDGLKHLLKSYSGMIKCIYIDPPYNTDSDKFVYKDRFKFTAEDLIQKLSIDEDQANHILDLTTKGSASHSAWLLFMYPRLQLARDLLKDDGAIFISIDDHEQANLKLICDDIFGEENCLGTIARSTGQTTGQDSGGLGSSFDYVFVYGRHPDLDIAGIPLNKHDLKRFNNRDEQGDYAYDQLRKTGSNDRREDRENMYYPILDPDGNEVFPIAPAGYESRWRVEKKTYERLLEDNLILWKKTSRNNESVWWPYVKYYSDGRTKRPSPLWTDLDGNKKATREVKALFDNVKLFDYVKPVALIEKIIQIAPNMEDGDIVLDFFAGSATTAHAVMDWNVKNKKQFRYIMIQLPEDLNPKENAQKITLDYLKNCGRNGTLDEVGQERIIRAAKKINEENPDSTADLGFKHYTLFDVNQNTLDKMNSFDDTKFITDTSVYDEFGPASILITWLIHDGYGFSNNINEIYFDDYVAYWTENHLYLINPNISQKAVIAIIDKYNFDENFNPQNIVIFGYSFNYTEMENIKANIKILRDSEKNLNINLDIRY